MSQSQAHDHQLIDPARGSADRSSSRTLRSGARAVRAALGAPAAKLVALPLAVALVGGGVAATSATFHDEVTMGVEVAAGTLNINVDGEEGNPTPIVMTLPLSQFKPGDTTTKTVQVRNTGTLPAVVVTSMTGKGPEALGAWLDATLAAGPVERTMGKAYGLANLGPFTVPAGGQVPLTITLSLPERTPNTWQGKTDTLTLTLSAAQE